MFVWAIIRPYLRTGLLPYLDSYRDRILGIFNPYVQISIHDEGKAYNRVKAYLSANLSKNAKRLKADLGKNSKKLVLSMDDHEKVSDKFRGVQVFWVLSTRAVPSSSNPNCFPEPEKRYYTLKFHRKHREMITQTYLEHVLKNGKEIQRQNRHRRLYTNKSKTNQYHGLKVSWNHIVYKHPATFETLAMDTDKKQEIIEDLLIFSKSKDYYARIGKACKRGYLLYGPPGTGKSTMIAAMANLLNYDIYDLELTAVGSNTELRMLLTETTSKSIIVIEDIDCSLDLSGQRMKKDEKHSNTDLLMNVARKESQDACKVTLSGLLNFIDGLWSACGGQRIIVQTTNYVEKLDPALIRTGRMDKHIEMSYCSFEGFKVLAKNYLEVEAHPTFDLIQQLITEVNITPADVAEKLMPKTAAKDADVCLSNLIRALDEVKDQQKKKELAKN
ncbi:hypothetical protein AgCh_011476 [Apium graveolens]